MVYVIITSNRHIRNVTYTVRNTSVYRILQYILLNTVELQEDITEILSVMRFNIQLCDDNVRQTRIKLLFSDLLSEYLIHFLLYTHFTYTLNWFTYNVNKLLSLVSSSIASHYRIEKHCISVFSRNWYHVRGGTIQTIS